MATAIPLGWTSPPPYSNRGTVRTTPEQVIYSETDESLEKSGQCGITCVRFIIGVAFFILFTALQGGFRSSSRSSSSSSSSTNTVYNKNRYYPSSSSTNDFSWLKELQQDIYQMNPLSNTKKICETGFCKEIVDEIVNSINKSVDPCDNFYDYACQGWQENNPIPEYMPEWSVFTKLRTKNTKRVIQILEKPVGIPLNDAKQFYRKCVEIENKTSEKEEKAAIQLLWKNLENFGGWPILYENGTWNESRFDWISSVVALKRRLKSTDLLEVSSYQYPSWMEKSNAIVIKPPSSSSASLETIDKFIESNKLLEGFKSLEDLQNLIVNISKVFLEFQGKSNVNETLLNEKAFEVILVRILLPSEGEPFKQKLTFFDKLSLGMKSQSDVANSSVVKIQNILDVKTLPFKNQLILLKLLQALYKNTNVYIHNYKNIVVSDMDYILNLAKFVSETKEEALANYLHFRMILQMIPLSGHGKLMNLLEDFENKLSGTSGKQERKEICAEKTQDKFNVAVGYEFVKETNIYNELEFKQAKTTFSNLKVSFRKLIKSSYMTYFNKALLKEEVRLTSLCLGYPKWMDLSGNMVEKEYIDLDMNKSATFLEQTMAVNMWEVDKSYGLLNKKLIKSYDGDSNCYWTIFAGDVGAYNAIIQFTVYLPLGIMQKPFYNAFMPIPLIYGKLGSILGHEIIHGFIGPGWSELENGGLPSSSQCIVNQYNNFSTPALRKENVTLDGLLTLKENIPDNAGLLGAYKAFKGSTLVDGREVQKLGGLENFTDEQLFFLGFAQNWCETSTQNVLRKSLEKDRHPPGRFRVLGSLQNSEEFAKAWKCQKGSKMNPFPNDHRKCKIF